jgi:hypothetical protein
MFKTLTITAIAVCAIAASAHVPVHAGLRTNGNLENGLRTNGTESGTAFNGQVTGIELPSPDAAPR